MALAALAAFSLIEAGFRLHFLVRNRLAAAPHGFELYAIGDSTMLGSPFEGVMSIPEIVARLLGGRVGGRPVLVANLAAPGETIYPQSQRLLRAVLYRDRSRPAILLVYSGHNDAGMGYVPPTRLAQAYEAVKERVLERSLVLGTLAFYGERAGFLPRCRTLATYEHYLRRAVETARAAGLTPILAVPASDVADIDPGLSLASASASSRPGLLAALAVGERLDRAGRHGEAAAYYDRLAADLSPIAYYLAYRAACSLRLAGRYEDARRRYWEALDTTRGDRFGRATTRHHEIIHRAAREHGAGLVDCARLFEERSAHGLVGDELFMDGHHPNRRGYFLIAEAFARAATRELGLVRKEPWPDAERLAAWFPMTTRQRVFSFLCSGRWLFTMAARQAVPEVRLALAEKRFRQAASEDPADFSAGLGLALVEAARRDPALLLEPAGVEWLARNGLFYGSTYSFSGAQWRLVRERLERAGVARRELDRLTKLLGPG